MSLSYKVEGFNHPCHPIAGKWWKLPTCFQTYKIDWVQQRLKWIDIWSDIAHLYLWLVFSNRQEYNIFMCLYFLEYDINLINSLRPSGAFMRQQIMPSLGQIMACRLIGAKPLSEPMLSYCQLGFKEYISVTFYLKFKSFHSWKCTGICHHFVSTSMC